ncbi:hypothetical protein MASR2M79_12420 [Aminivibrio sp.]
MVRAKWGRIINLASVVAIIEIPVRQPLRLEGGGHRADEIRCPGVRRQGHHCKCHSPGIHFIRYDRSLPAEAREALMRQIPAGRAGTPKMLPMWRGFSHPRKRHI